MTNLNDPILFLPEAYMLCVLLYFIVQGLFNPNVSSPKYLYFSNGSYIEASMLILLRRLVCYNIPTNDNWVSV